MGQQPQSVPKDLIVDDELRYLLPDLEDKTLIGSRIASAIQLFGIPPCTKCKNRIIWLNAVHRYFRAMRW